VRNLRTYLIALLACAGTFLAVPESVGAADIDLAQAINKAGRQRMLTQRIIKAYAQVGQGITPQVSKRQLDDAVLLFEVQLGELGKIVPDEHGRRSVARLDQLWRPFKAAATGSVDRNGAERLLGMDDGLVNAAHELTVELQNRSTSTTARLVNTAGRQRMLSQRLAKYYLLRAWGMESSFIGKEISSALVEFDGALLTLRAAPENTAQIKRELDAVALQWEWFRNALGLEGAASYGLIVVNASEAILNSMELVTGLYEQLPAK
jgi:Type IV pili methyl-accepting chemotaxis transducer N-term